MAKKVRDEVPQLPVILIVDTDNDIQEFIIFNPSAESSNPEKNAKIKKGTSTHLFEFKLI